MQASWQTSPARPAPRSPAARWLSPLLPVALVVGFCLLLLERDPRFFWNDDYQTCFLPVFLDMARAWEAGEPPLLSPYSWYGGALAGEYRYGSFSIFIQLVVALVFQLKLTLPATAALFSILHLGVLAAGASCLARHRGLSVELSTLVAVVAALNGWIVSWAATAWVTSLTSFAWVPWAWWALEQSLDRERGARRFLPAGVFIYLIAAAGSPFSVLMVAVLTLFLAAKVGHGDSRASTLWPLAAAWVSGLALASPAILMLAEHLRNGLRGGQLGTLETVWLVPPAALLGLLLPSFSTEWVTFVGEESRPAVELACGLLPPVALAAALARLRGRFVRHFFWGLVTLALVLALSMLPSLAPFRWSFRWLPLFHLVLALLGAEALASLRADDALEAADPRAAPRRLTGFAVVAAALAYVTLERIATFGPDAPSSPLALSALLGAAALLGAFLARKPLAWAARFGPARWLPCLVVLLSLWTTYSEVPTRWVRRWELPESILSAEPLDPRVLYLSLFDKQEAFAIDAGLSRLIRPGNLSLYAGVPMVHGYSTIGPAGLVRVLQMRSHFGFSSDIQARRLIEKESGPEGLLEIMGVDGLVLSRRWQAQGPKLLERGWEKVAASEDGAVFHRLERSPPARCVPSVELVATPEEVRERILLRSSTRVPLLVVRSETARTGSVVEYSPCALEGVENARLGSRARVGSLSSERPSLVVFSRPWYPGFRATLDGRPLDVEALDLVLLAVEVPAGASGVLVVEYRPATLRAGLAVAAVALVAGIAVAAVGRPAGLRRFRRAD